MSIIPRLIRNIMVVAMHITQIFLSLEKEKSNKL